MDLPARAGVPGWLCLVGVAALVLLGAARVTADDWQEPVRLEYASPVACPDRAAFEARVLARTARALFVASDRDERTFEITLESGAHPSGRLTVRRGGGVEGTRDVHADTCTDVADALALVVALAIDPSLLASPAASAPSSATGSPSTSLPAGPSVSSSSPVATAPAPSAPPAPPPPAPSPPPQPVARTVLRPPPPTPSPPVQPPQVQALFAGVEVEVATGVSPATLIGISPEVGWQSKGTSVFAPSVSLSFLHGASGRLSLPAGDASFTWNVGRVDGCALSWRRGSTHLLGCLRIEAGALDAAGSQVTSPQKSSRGWLAAGPFLRGDWEVSPPLFVGARAGAMLRGTADHFFFSPDTNIYQVPIVGLEASAGLGVNFL